VLDSINRLRASGTFVIIAVIHPQIQASMTTITLAPVNILHIVYSALALFSLALIFGKQRFKALALLLVAHFVQEIFNIFEELNIFIEDPIVTPAVQLAIGPLYYLFAKNLIYGDLQVKRNLIHLLPAFIGLGFTAWWPELLKVAFILLLIYFFLTFRLLSHYHRVLAEITADCDTYALDWLTRTLVVVGIIEFVDFIRLNVQLELSYDVFTNWYFVSELLSLTITIYLVLKALRQPQLFAGFAEFEKIVNTKQTADNNGQTGELDQARTVFVDISRYLKKSQAYRQAKYSLRQLAGEMGLSEQMISWSINQGGGLSFSDYVNSLRIEAVKQSFLDTPEQRNILQTAFDAGFSSKSTFNAVFKRNLGVTPSQYLKNLQ
jgi:AraC-like DNA-binding protein